MSARQPARESSFSWPPSSADLDRIDVFDVARHRSGLGAVVRDMGTTLQLVALPTPLPTPDEPAPPAAPPAWWDAVDLARFARERRWVLPHMARRAVTADRVMLLAAGVLLGATLPGLDDGKRPLTAGVATTAARASDVRGDGAALLAMREVLRSERRTGTSAGTPAPAPVQPESRPTAEAVTQPLPTATVRPAAARAVATGRAVGSPAFPVRPATRAAHGAAARPPDVPPPDPRTAPVLRVVDAYERAWTRMDAAATRALWPSADPHSLSRRFGGIREQRLQLSACAVDMSDRRATAACRGTLRYRPRVGDTRVSQGTWEFDLERTAHGWSIRTVDMP